LLAPGEFPELVVEQEAASLWRKPPESLTPTERQRLNRLILEGAYPDSIRKIYGRAWREVMLLYGLLGIVVAGAFWMVFRNTPGEHPRVNAAERAIIEGTQPVPKVTQQGASKLPIRILLTSPSLWLMSISQFTTNFGWVFVATWLPRYLEEAHRTPTAERSVMTAVPIAVGCAGMFLGGPFTDRLTSLMGQRWGRALPLASTRFIAMAAFLGCLAPGTTAWTATAAMALMAFSVDLGVPATWAFTQDVGGRYTGSVLGWGNMWGNFGAAAAPMVLNSLVGETKNWAAAFVACAIAFLISGVVSLGIDATQKVAED
jgi:nitrate/nitrite transporter NarK